MNTALRALLGAILGVILSGASYYGAASFAGAGHAAALAVGLVVAAVGGVYAAIASASNVYAPRFLSIVGLVLDLTWSLLNTAAGLLVWLPACAIAGGSFITPNDDSRRSGTFVYANNPRGGGYSATTVATVIAGGWNTHEELHVWQARIFGPLYLLGYGIAWVLQSVFLPVVGKVRNVAFEAYNRICFEDWAYWGGSLSRAIRWSGWLAGFLLSLLYVGMLAAIPLGAALHAVPLMIVGAAGLVVYHVIRALTPGSV